MGEAALKRILDTVVKSTDSKDGEKTSGWKVLVYIVVGVIAVALAVIPAVLARRKAAKIAHERDKLLEEKKQVELRAALEKEKAKRDRLLAEIDTLDKEAEASEIKILELEKKRKEFADNLNSLVNWSDIPGWGDSRES